MPDPARSLSGRTRLPAAINRDNGQGSYVKFASLSQHPTGTIMKSRLILCAILLFASTNFVRGQDKAKKQTAGKKKAADKPAKTEKPIEKVTGHFSHANSFKIPAILKMGNPKKNHERIKEIQSTLNRRLGNRPIRIRSARNLAKKSRGKAHRDKDKVKRLFLESGQHILLPGNTEAFLAREGHKQRFEHSATC